MEKLCRVWLTIFMGLTQQLNAEGQRWVKPESESPEIEDEEFADYVWRLRGAFSLTQEEAVAAVAQAHAMAIGPAFLIQDPSGRKYPPSLQTVLYGTQSSVARATEALCHAAMEVFMKDFNSYAQSPNSEDKDRRAAEVNERDAQYARIMVERRNSLFPYGYDMSDQTITQLLLEGKEVSYGLIGTHDQFSSLMSALGKKGQLLRDFVDSGWSGRTIGGRNNHPLYPTCNAVWAVDSLDVDSLVARQGFRRFPGILYAMSSREPSEEEDKGKIVNDWKIHVQYVLKFCRSALAMRHYTDSPIMRFTFSDEAKRRLLDCLKIRKYARPGTEAEAFFTNAGIQIAKIAALMRPIDQCTSPIGVSCVSLAEETYRWFAKNMLLMLDEASSSSRSNAKSIAAAVQKLRRHGPLSAHELRRTFHNMRAAEMKKILSEAVDGGYVVELGGKYKVSTIDPQG